MRAIQIDALWNICDCYENTGRLYITVSMQNDHRKGEFNYFVVVKNDAWKTIQYAGISNEILG